MEQGRIHLIGICGIAMGTLAGMLKMRGFEVTGSDANAYPPMSDILRRMNIPVAEGFHERNLSGADLAVIGNAVSRGNPEAESVLDSGIPYLSMAQALQRFFFAGKEVVAVAGTHGKTTTTALLAHILRSAGEDPSFFVGGVLRNYDTNFGLGDGRFFIVEGDEYDSAFFEKVPKFIIYRPRHLVLTSLEFDHADIYRDLGEIELMFRRLVNIIPSLGYIVYSREYENLETIVSGSLSRCRSYGAENADFNWKMIRRGEKSALLEISLETGLLTADSPITGDYNFMNVTAAAAMASLLGVPMESIRAGIESFQGVKRRMELIYRKGGTLVFEDFAHHPTAIGSVLSDLRAQYPDHLLWAVYEPRSATSRRNTLGHLLPKSFACADRVLLREPYKLDGINPAERIDIGRIRSEICEIKGDPSCAGVYENADAIVASLSLSIDVEGNNIIIIMSNGGFEGIYGKLCRALESPAN